MKKSTETRGTKLNAKEKNKLKTKSRRIISGTLRCDDVK